MSEESRAAKERVLAVYGGACDTEEWLLDMAERRSASPAVGYFAEETNNG